MVSKAQRQKKKNEAQRKRKEEQKKKNKQLAEAKVASQNDKQASDEAERQVVEAVVEQKTEECSAQVDNSAEATVPSASEQPVASTNLTPATETPEPTEPATKTPKPLASATKTSEPPASATKTPEPPASATKTSEPPASATKTPEPPASATKTLEPTEPATKTHKPEAETPESPEDETKTPESTGSDDANKHPVSDDFFKAGETAAKDEPAPVVNVVPKEANLRIYTRKFLEKMRQYLKDTKKPKGCNIPLEVTAGSEKGCNQYFQRGQARNNFGGNNNSRYEPSGKDQGLNWRRAPRELHTPQTVHTIKGKTALEVVQKSIRSVLNKLAPEKFNELMGQVDQIVLDTNEKMSAAISIIFEKALDESKFAELYAKMCRHVSLQRKNSGEAFRKAILLKCQKEFEHTTKLHENLKKFDVEIEKEADEERRSEMRGESEVRTRTFKKRMKGNIKFVGELFKQRMLGVNVMKYCVSELFKGGTDEHYDTMCSLLATVGRQMESEGSGEYLDGLFAKFARGLENKAFESSRIRFMFQDLTDLRTKRNWVDKKKMDAAPKKLKDVEREHNKEKLKHPNHSNKSGGYRDPRSNYGSGFSRGVGKNNNSTNVKKEPDQWNVVQKPARQERNKNNKNNWGVNKNENYQKYDPSRMRNFGSKPSNSDVRLGPPKNKWNNNKANASSNGKLSKGDSDLTQVKNRFSALVEDQSSQPGSTNNLSNKSLPAGSGANSSPSTEPTEKNENVSEPPKPSPRKQPEEVKLSAEEMKRKAAAVAEEYIQLRDASEAERCCEEVGMRANGAAFVSSCVTYVVEKKVEDCHLVGDMLKHLMEKKAVTAEQAEEALTSSVKGAIEDELHLDVTQLWRMMAHVVVKMYEQLSMERVVTIASSAADDDEDFRLQLIVNVLRLLKEERAMEGVAGEWKRHGDWSKFTGDGVAGKLKGDLLEFYQEFKQYSA